MKKNKGTITKEYSDNPSKKTKFLFFLYYKTLFPLKKGAKFFIL